MSTSTNFCKSDLEAALAYARWLHLAEFTKWQNTYRRELGLPVETPPVCLNSRGKRVYEDLRKGVRDRRCDFEGVLTVDGERKAVLAEIYEGLNRRVK